MQRKKIVLNISLKKKKNWMIELNFFFFFSGKGKFGRSSQELGRSPEVQSETGIFNLWFIDCRIKKSKIIFAVEIIVFLMTSHTVFSFSLSFKYLFCRRLKLWVRLWECAIIASDYSNKEGYNFSWTFMGSDVSIKNIKLFKLMRLYSLSTFRTRSTRDASLWQSQKIDTTLKRP